MAQAAMRLASAKPDKESGSNEQKMPKFKALMV